MVASRQGWDPLKFLALEGDDLRLALEIIAARQKADDEYERGRLDYLSSRTASLTAQLITGWIAKSLKRH